MQRFLLSVVLVVCSMQTGAGEEAVVVVGASGFIAFNHLDSDNNGYVSRVEARSIKGVERVFEHADANSDGLLDRREYRRAVPDYHGGRTN